MAKPIYQQYETFQEKRKTLVTLIHELQGVLNSLDMADTKNTIEQLEYLVQSDSFKVLVIGEFKRGKSTFINAMLGYEILPAYAKPCTAIINEVKWGEQRRALLHPSRTEEPHELQPQEVPVKQLEEYVVIQDDGSKLHGNRYEKVELFWPLELCQNGVEIIDSPGLNEHDIRQKVTMDYLSRVDAILFVLSCEALASQSELHVIDNILRPSGHEDIFFICNRFNMIRAKEREDIKQHGISKLSPRTTRGAERIFFISALDGLEGRIENDEEKVTKSGMVQVEQELEKFLVNERGKQKLFRPAREMRNAIYSARRTIPERISMLKTDIKTLEVRFEDVQEPLRRLETKRDQIVRLIDNFLDDIKMTIGAEACSFYLRLPEKVDEWVKALETKSTVNFISRESTKLQAERLVEEVITFLGSKIENEFLGWRNEILQTLVTDKLQELMKKLDERASDIVDTVNTLRLQVSGTPVSPVSIDGLAPKEVGALELLTGNFGSAGVVGYQEMAKSIVPQIGLGLLCFVLGLTNPLILMPILLSGGFIQGVWSAQSTNTKIKEEVAKRYGNSIRDSAPQRGNELAEAVVTELSKIQGINAGLGREIQSVRDQFNSILAEKKQGQANVDQKLDEIESVRNELDGIDSKVAALIDDIAS